MVYIIYIWFSYFHLGSPNFQASNIKPIGPFKLPDARVPEVDDSTDLILSLKLSGMYYVNYVRVECDFAQSDFTRPSEQHSCLIAISFVDSDSISEPASIIKGHTFNLLTTAHSSRKHTNKSVRYKATIRSTALTLTPTNYVQLSLPFKADSDICVRPLTIRLAVFGTPIGSMPHASISRKAVLESPRISAITKSLIELLATGNLTCTHRELAVDVLQSIIGSTKNASTSVAQHPSLTTIISQGATNTAICSSSTTGPLMLNVYEVAPKTKPILAAATIGAFPSLLTSGTSPTKISEYFDILKKFSSSSTADVSVSVVMMRYCRRYNLFIRLHYSANLRS